MATKRSDGIFARIASLVAVLVCLFMLSAILSIVFGGIGSFLSNLRQREVLAALKLSIITSTISSLVVMLLAVMVAYAFTRTNMPFKGLMGIVMELSMSLPYILLGLALLIMFSSPFGRWLKVHGIKVVFAPLGIVMAHILVNLPYAVRLVRDCFEAVDPRLEFIAGTLGAGEARRFSTILLPISIRGIISASILIWSRAMGEFGATLMLVGITRMKTETLPGNVYLNISTGNNEEAMATATLMLFISALAMMLSRIAEKKSLLPRRGNV